MYIVDGTIDFTQERLIAGYTHIFPVWASFGGTLLRCVELYPIYDGPYVVGATVHWGDRSDRWYFDSPLIPILESLHRERIETIPLR